MRIIYRNSSQFPSTFKFLGWLYKKGHRVNNWKYRWFDLSFDTEVNCVRLRYYTNQSKTEVKGEHVLSASSQVFGIPNDGTHKYCFKLIARGTKASGKKSNPMSTKISVGIFHSPPNNTTLSLPQYSITLSLAYIHSVSPPFYTVEELIMDAEAAHLRMKWIMAIESFVIDLKPSGSSLHDPNSLEGLEGGGGGEDDEDGMLSALSTQKLTPTEKEIMACVHSFVDAWMRDKEEAFISATTEGT